MDRAKIRKPRLSERNAVYWVDKDNRFIREQSVRYPKPSWSAGHTVGSIVITLIWVFVLIMMLVFSDGFVKLIFSFAIVIPLALYLADELRAEKRKHKFQDEIVSRGGHFAGLWTERTVKRNRYRAYAASTLCIVLACAFIAMDVLLEDLELEAVYTVLPLFALTTTINNGQAFNEKPNIFMDVSEGMLFGGALFSYEIMSGIRSTGKKHGFELYHDRKKVAYGTMSPDDMKYLREMIAIYGKYRKVLENETASDGI